MKKYILAVVLTSFAATSYAGTKEQLCPLIADLAITIMTARQQGLPLEVLMQAADQDVNPVYEDLAKVMILNAYAGPRYDSEEYKSQAIVDFGNAASVACYSSEG